MTEKCSICGKDMIYDTDVMGYAWGHLGLGLHALCYELQKQNQSNRRIARSDIKGFWKCPNKRHSHKVVFNIIE